MSAPAQRWGETFWVFLRLGCTSFGGPVAHLGYFREEFVVRRRWLEEAAYGDLVALSQFLPGPTSSQVGLALGLHRAGWLGAALAWLGFTAPSALLMILAGYGLASLGPNAPRGWLAGLELAAVAVVAQAVVAMAIKFCLRPLPAALALLSAAALLALPTPATTGLVLMAASFGAWLGRGPAVKEEPARAPLGVPYGRRLGAGLLALFFVLLLTLPLAARLTAVPAVLQADAFYRAGSLVFGGGHVVLPLLQQEVVRPGWVGEVPFLSGYALAQAVPGPLFSFAAYLGTIIHPAPNGVAGALLCLGAIYLPAALLIFGALPFWEALRQRPDARAALAGANAAVVGILFAALLHPIGTGAIHRWSDLALALAAYVALTVLRFPPWVVVALAGAGGAIWLN